MPGLVSPTDCQTLRALVPRPCLRYLPCCCPDADDGHCWVCGHLRGEHREVTRAG